MRTYYCFLLLVWVGQCQQIFTGSVVKRTRSRKEKGQVSDSNGKELNRYKRSWMWNQFFLLEEYTGSDYQYVGKLHSDQDKGDGSLKYILSGDGAGDLFIINENTGDIQATRRLDREEKPVYILRAQAVNKRTGIPVEPESEFIIKIHDINDSEPKFTKEIYTGTVPEMSEVGTFVLQVTATDADDPTYGNSARVVYSILQGQPYFSVESESGVIKTALPNMDRENKDKYQVVIQAKDMGGQMGGLSGTTVVNITLTDVNDNPPRFPQSTYQFKIAESAPPGHLVGKIKANDIDEGVNAEITYHIADGDGSDMFDLITDKNTQEGLIMVKKALDFEKKKLYTLKVEAVNTNVDPRFLYLGPFKDFASIRINVEDVDEPPVFSRPVYILEVKEDVKINSTIGTVTAQDPDVFKRPVRYSLDRHTDMDRIFNIDHGNGSIFASKSLDRETLQWHNITVIATEIENPKDISRVPVFIKVLDVNDNAPELAMFYETFICENAKAGQLIQTISAVDKDDSPQPHFLFSLVPEAVTTSNFTVHDNKDNTAGIVTRRNGYNRHEINTYLLPVLISDSDYPIQSSTGTLTIRVCACDRWGNMQSCHAEALIHPTGLSTGALIAILLCIIILLVTVVLFAALRRQRKKEPLIVSKEDIRDNIVSYNDEGGGEEDTQAFDIGTLRNPEAIEDNKLRRDIVPETLFLPRRTATARDNTDVRDFINQRLKDNDTDPTAPPYDSLATYAYEGNGSVAESLSSLGSMTTEGDQDYDYLNDWGPRFRKLADMYGSAESDKDS
uniref:Cadherin-6 n=1 Tax=Geotrypetes seraphini TaxID=260995 RepID=A0A6P8Q6F8_GEOSA|nr:cadherin-6-like [Geotrypetes seraphini]XP_033790873.1 cadherin-6-like [Geotrypetes seraphini]XP_033790874.1 cadherin-6-like [Geotrypetes seraphini]XP_033790875.1 cadherin-6-like [Geotrypetes seraphini]XP_033790876.1 cadherin-6-like [Geotrypetes seraphini]